MSRSVLYLLTGLCLLSSSAVWGQLPLPIVTEETARRHGLHRPWITYLEIDSGRDRIISVVYYQAEPQGGKEGAAPPMPMPPPAVGAAENAAQPAQPVPGESNVEPGILVVVTERGIVQALNPETGQSLWVKQVGQRNKYLTLASVNSNFVAVMEGMTLHLLDRGTGEMVRTEETNIVTMTGPALSEEWVYVTSLTGAVQAYRLPVEEAAVVVPGQKDARKNGTVTAPGKRAEEPRYVKEEGGSRYSEDNRWNYSSFGRIDSPPLPMRNRIAWATSRGFLYTSSLDKPNVSGRFETKKEVSAPLSYWPPYIFVASRDGSVYAVPETTTGSIAWRYPAGDSISQKPVALGDAVYVIPDNHVLHCVGMHDGAHRWSQNGIVKFVAASPTRVYAKDELGRLQILEAKTGARLSQFDVGRLNLAVTNDRSDRIFLGTERGLLFCLHEPALAAPAIHVFPTEAEIRNAARAAAAAKPKPMADDQGAP